MQTGFLRFDYQTIQSREGPMTCLKTAKIKFLTKRVSCFLPPSVTKRLTSLSEFSCWCMLALCLPGNCVNEEMFYNPILSCTTAAATFRNVSNFFQEDQLSWDSLIGVCTDGTPSYAVWIHYLGERKRLYCRCTLNTSLLSLSIQNLTYRNEKYPEHGYQGWPFC